MADWTASFHLSITRALGDQLAATIAPLRPAPLTYENLAEVLPRPGVYELFLFGERVYVGKAAKSLHDRLRQHMRKISGRTGIDQQALTFACVYVDEDLDSAAPEKLLIKKYRQTGSIPWNNNGFGNKDPGRNRDNSLVKAQHFDAEYRINLDCVINFEHETATAWEALDRAKREAPYLVRFDKKKKPVYRATPLALDPAPITIRELVTRLVSAFPVGWQATALPGYVIFYQENHEYDSALAWWRRDEHRTAVMTRGPQHFAAGAVHSDDEDADDDPSDDDTPTGG